MQKVCFKTEPFRVGLLAFSDGRLRVHKTLEDTIKQHINVITEAINKDPLLEIVNPDDIAYSSKIARKIAKEMRQKDIEAAVFAIPVFAFPNFSVLAARVLDIPVLLSSPKDGKLPGLGGIMAAHGAMKQVNIPSEKIWGNPLEEKELLATLSAFCRASGVIERMKGSVYGLIGGRSIGMNTGVPDTQQWMQKFGIDVDHIDQLEILRRTKLFDQDDVDKVYKWLQTNLGKYSTEGKAAPNHVQEQIRQYLAVRSIIDDFGLDFIGIKCHYDLSEYFTATCLSAVFLNDPYDWNGEKEPTVMACEADSDGALTMQILKLISGCPTLLFDVRTYDFENNVFVCCNCGAQPSWYAAQSNDPAENLSKVHLEPLISKYAGNGAHFSYVCKSSEITMARLSRVNGQYRMFLAPGEFVDFPREKMAETCSAWPHGYVRMNVDPKEFLSVFNANHAHVIPGNHLQALEFYCKMMNIPVDRVG